MACARLGEMGKDPAPLLAKAGMTAEEARNQRSGSKCEPRSGCWNWPPANCRTTCWASTWRAASISARLDCFTM